MDGFRQMDFEPDVHLFSFSKSVYVCVVLYKPSVFELWLYSVIMRARSDYQF